MAKAKGRDCPYHAVIEEILALAHRAVASGDDGGRAVALVAQLRAIALVNSFHALDTIVPAPAVRTSSTGGVVLRWTVHEQNVEIVFLAAGGQFTVADVQNGELLHGGLLDEVDPLHDVVSHYVLRRPSAAYAG
ncbi:MAG: hypothetical protein ACREJ9_02785 [Candidatus Rokuibacteriota bacterium]